MPLASETPSAFKSASTVAPELVLTFANNFTLTPAKGAPKESTVITVNLQSVFFSQELENTSVKQAIIKVDRKNFNFIGLIINLYSKNTKKNNKMYHKIVLLSIMLFLISKKAFSQTFSKETILIETSFGKMKVKLFEETPLHKANFIKLVQNHFYDSLLFHRIIEGFMIQGGDPESKHAEPIKLLGDGDLNYTIPAEITKKLCHKKGMLCAARNGDDINPSKASSACQFYIVQGKVRTDEELLKFEKRINNKLIDSLTTIFYEIPSNKNMKARINKLTGFAKQDSLEYLNKKQFNYTNTEYLKLNRYTFTKEQEQIYKSIGGTPHLDNNYTIFGEVIEGLEVIDEIAKANINKDDRPLIDIRMKINLIVE